MKLQRKVYATRGEKVLDFVLGFAGWFLVNGLIYGCSIVILQAGLFDTSDSVLPVLLGLLPLLLNIAVVILFAFTRRWIALGILAAFALVLLGVLLLGLLVYAICYNQGLFQ